MDASGIPIGIGAGIVIGIATGRNAVLSSIRKYADANHTEIQIGGSPVSMDDFLSAATRAEIRGRKKLLVGVLLLGVLLLAGLILYTRS